MNRIPVLLFTLLSLTFFSCNGQQKTTQSAKAKNGIEKIADYVSEKDYDTYSVATFAGGCFWCTEASFEQIEGVIDVISGYSGGSELYPTYKEVANKMTSHAEAIQIYFDPEVISFDQLLDIFFVAHDPTTLNRQGPDVGPQYRSAIYYHNDSQKEAAKTKIKKLNESGYFQDPIVTELTAYEEFWVAEDYHQDYYPNNPGNPYVQRVSRPKVEKVAKKFSDLLKEK